MSKYISTAEVVARRNERGVTFVEALRQLRAEAKAAATTDIHSCSYYCERPACVLAQRDVLRDHFYSHPRKPA